MQESDQASWETLAQGLICEGRAFIDGAYREARSEQRFVSQSAIDSHVVCHVAECGEEDVDIAVSVARRAFSAGVWSRRAPRERKAVLRRFAQLIRDHAIELALIESIDAGKTIRETAGGGIESVAYCIDWFAEAIDKWPGEVAPVDPELFGYVTREPVGVVAAVVPWNFPLAMAGWKFAPALAAGNSVILKPSERAPLSAIRVAELASEAGIPPGVFNVLPGFGSVGDALARHPDVDCIAFTGSTATGRHIMRRAAESNLKRVWLELGGKSAHIVLPDCPDLEKAAKVAADAIFFNSGQMCSAGSRLILHRDIADVFVPALLDAARTYEPGHPFDPRTRMGPVIDAALADNVMYVIETARRHARLLMGGHRADVVPGGHYIAPTIFQVDASDDSALSCEEIFGPVLALTIVDDADEAVALANRSIYGLGAGLWTSDVQRAHSIARRLQAGTVWVNCYEEGNDMNFPFGGWKQSGNGRDRSLHALEKYTELKATVIRLGAS